MEEQTKTNVVNVPSEESFTLIKASRLKGGGLAVVYEVSSRSGKEICTESFKVDSPRDVHPDLSGLFNELKPILCRTLGFTSYLTMVESKEFKARDTQVNISRDWADEFMKNVLVSSVTLSGTGDNESVVLSGVLTVANGQNVPIKTPKLKTQIESFGFETELMGILGDIESEVYDYLFRAKRAQLEIFDENMSTGESGQETEDGPTYSAESASLFGEEANVTENDLHPDGEELEGNSEEDDGEHESESEHEEPEEPECEEPEEEAEDGY